MITWHWDLTMCRVLLDSKNSKAFLGDKINKLKHNNNYDDVEPNPEVIVFLAKFTLEFALKFRRISAHWNGTKIYTTTMPTRYYYYHTFAR